MNARWEAPWCRRALKGGPSPIWGRWGADPWLLGQASLCSLFVPQWDIFRSLPFLVTLSLPEKSGCASKALEWPLSKDWPQHVLRIHVLAAEGVLVQARCLGCPLHPQQLSDLQN